MTITIRPQSDKCARLRVLICERTISWGQADVVGADEPVLDRKGASDAASVRTAFLLDIEMSDDSEFASARGKRCKWRRCIDGLAQVENFLTHSIESLLREILSACIPIHRAGD
jgi:hypothetical protein